MNQPQRPFTIDSVQWHLNVPETIETPRYIYDSFRSLISFLQNNNLTVHTIVDEADPITDDVAIQSTDLTDKGMQLMKACHGRWVDRIDRGGAADDVSIFEKWLKKHGDDLHSNRPKAR